MAGQDGWKKRRVDALAGENVGGITHTVSHLQLGDAHPEGQAQAVERITGLDRVEDPTRRWPASDRRRDRERKGCCRRSAAR
jgi:hypothetical protein